METMHILETISRTDDGVFAVDEDQRIIYWNAGAEKILGYSAQDVIGRSCFDVMKGFDESSKQVCYLDCPIIDCAKAGLPTPGREIKVRAKDGSGRWLGMTHTYVNNESRHLAAVVHIFRDATEGMEAKKTLERISREVSAYGVDDTEKEPEIHHDGDMTEREKQVVSLLTQGEGTSGIAKKLMISNATARNHIQNILVKLNVHTRLEAVAYVLRHRLNEEE
jgi:PAS domain S-box-containing protein